MYINKDMNNKIKSLREFAPVGTKECESNCAREIAMTPKGPVVICTACKRIVIDNRK